MDSTFIEQELVNKLLYISSDDDDDEDSLYKIDETYHRTSTHAELLTVPENYSFIMYASLFTAHNNDKTLQPRTFHRLWTSMRSVSMKLQQLRGSEYTFAHHHLYFSEATYLFERLKNFLTMKRTIYSICRMGPNKIDYCPIGQASSLSSARELVINSMRQNGPDTTEMTMVYEGTRQEYSQMYEQGGFSSKGYVIESLPISSRE